MISNLIYITVAAILIFVLYLAVQAITRGVEAKNEIKTESSADNQLTNKNDNVYDQLVKLKELHENGVLNKEEFEKAKKKNIKVNISSRFFFFLNKLRYFILVR